MVRRPWPLVVLAFLHGVAPIFNLAIGAMLTHQAFFHHFKRVMIQSTPLQMFENFLMLPLAGLAIYAFRTWSYFAYLGVIAMSFYFNYLKWDSNPQLFTMGILLACYALNLLTVTYFLLPAVRVAYFNPSLRWWESKPRYPVNILSRLHQGEREFDAEITNISEGGVFIRLSEDALRIGDHIRAQFTIFQIPIELHGRVVHVGDDVRPGYGVQFTEHMTEAMRLNVKRLTQALRIIGVGPRAGRQNWKKDFARWLTGLVTRGEGLMPEQHLPRKEVTTPPKPPLASELAGAADVIVMKQTPKKRNRGGKNKRRAA